MRIENSFQVPASPERTWAFFNDAPRVVPCMPGAELTEVVDENTWKVTMHVKLGPIALRFGADVQRERVDEGMRVVNLQAQARELRGRGSAQATIKSCLVASDGGTSVTVVTDLNLQGAIAQYGRGIVADVASQLTRQFADSVASQLQEGGDRSGTPPADAGAVKPIGGLRLAVGALWRRILAFLWRR